MTAWQLITILCVIVGGFGIADLVVIIRMRRLRHAIEEQFTACRHELKADFAAWRSDLRHARIKADIREIKEDLRQVFKPVLPG